jgi:hypothetical protein
MECVVCTVCGGRGEGFYTDDDGRTYRLGPCGFCRGGLYFPKSSWPTKEERKKGAKTPIEKAIEATLKKYPLPEKPENKKED